MRGATECAKRLKLLTSSLRSKLGKVTHPPVTDPITQLILGVLTRDTPESKAGEGLERLRGMVVDYNELRVIPPIELAQVLGDFSDARLKCEDISRALNAVFAQEHAISLDRLASMSRRDATALLDDIDGLDPYSRARIRLLGLRHHAVPLDEAMWAYARAQGVIDPRCPLHEAQAFFERQIAEEDTLEFIALFKKQAWAECGNAVRRRDVERILSIPPDRTSRNMLQMVSAAAADADHEPELEDELGDEEAPPEPRGGKRPRKPAATKRESKPAAAVAPQPKPARKARPAGKPAAKASSAGGGRSGRRRPAAKSAVARPARAPARKSSGKSGRTKSSRAESA